MSDDNSRRQTADDGETQTYPVVEAEDIKDEERGNCNQHSTGIGADSERTEQLAHTCSFFGAHKEDADEREEDTDSGNNHGGDDSPQLHVASRSKGRGAQSCRRKNGTAIALIKVSAHTGNVAHVVAYVVGNGGRVARVVLWDVGFNFSNNVGAYIGCFRIDTASNAGEEGLGGSSHTEGEHRGSDGDERNVVRAVDKRKSDEPEGNVQQSEAHNDQPHYRAGAESNTQTAVQTLARSIGGSGGSIGSGLHTEEAS